MRLSRPALLACGLLLAAVPAMAEPSPADRNFAMKAAQGHLAEIANGQLVAAHAGSPAVRQFGQRMVTDHGQALQDLQQIAEQENLNLPTQPSQTQQAGGRQLTGMAGTGFDTEYARHAIQSHQQDVALFRGEAQSGRDPALKAYAQKYLPIVRQHLQMAQRLGARG